MKLKKKIVAVLLLMMIPVSLLGCSFTDKLTQKDPTDELTEGTVNDDSNPTDGDEDEDTTTNAGVVDKEQSEDASNETEATQVKEMKTYRVFYYDTDYNIYYYDKSVEVVDKAVVKAITNQLKTSPNESLKATLSNNIEIRGASLEGDTITVDFGSNFYDEMSLGSGSESAMLTCLVNTFGYNYNVENVIIKVNGENYKSGHIVLQDGNVFTVEFDNATQGK